MPASRTPITAVSAAAPLLSAGGAGTGSAAPASSAKPKAVPGDVTPPGAELEVGDRAVVPRLRVSTRSGVELEVTSTAGRNPMVSTAM